MDEERFKLVLRLILFHVSSNCCRCIENNIKCIKGNENDDAQVFNSFLMTTKSESLA